MAEITLSFLVYIVSMCILTGSINTVFSKWMNVTSALGSDGTVHKFEHPFVQTLGMFLGELFCYVAYRIYVCTKAGREFHNENNKIVHMNWWFAIPATLDFITSVLMNVGLILTYASVFQMLRGSVVLFTSLLAYIFLKKRFNWNQITGLILVIVGLLIVGVSSVFLPKSSHAPNPMIGNWLIVAACLISAVQFVLEDYFLTKYNVQPLLAVGYEGIFGFSITAVLLIPFYWIPGPSVGNKLENSIDAFVQMGNSAVIIGTFMATIISVSFFNYYGLTITKHMSSTSRVLVDSVRTLIIWAVCLIVGWEKFQYLQPVGYLFLVFGFLVFNSIIVFPCFVEKIQKLDASSDSFDETIPLNQDASLEDSSLEDKLHGK